MKARALSCGLVTLMWAGAALAGDAPLLPGSRVRVETAAGTITGNVLGWEADRVTLINTGYGDPYVVRLDSISKLELSRGRKRPILKSTIIGAALGAGVMALAPLQNPCAPGVQSTLDGYCESKGTNIAIGVLGGAGWGALIGALRHSDRWEDVPATRFRVSIAPVAGGVAAAIAVSR